ncbi:hypothetical protein ACSFBM_19150 [Variovorax sp. GB1R11]|uniref:hypothetical protein n=1 Tax=Variovorax sp. GB1R11 TaxID=3443741 RepID=UPI003F44CE5D
MYSWFNLHRDAHHLGDELGVTEPAALVRVDDLRRFSALERLLLGGNLKVGLDRDAQSLSGSPSPAPPPDTPSPSIGT